MRPLVAALAVAAPEGAAYELHGTARMHERPIGDLVDALRALGCRIDYLGREGYPPLAIASPSARRSRRRCPGARPRRRVEPVPDRPAARPAPAPRQQRRRDRGRGRADLAALRRHHPAPARALRHRRRARGMAALHPARRGSRCARPGPSWSKATRPRRPTSSPPAPSPPSAAPLRIEGVGSDSIQGDIAFVDAARAMGAHVEAVGRPARGPARPPAAGGRSRSTATTSPTRR